MLITGILVITTGILLAPVLGHGQEGLVTGYRIVFCTTILAFVGASYTFSLQARDIARWNIVRISQPVVGFIAILVLWWAHQLTLRSALLVLAATMLLQLGFAYWSCRQVGLVPGRAKKALIRPLVTYGAMQIAALAPASVNAELDQLVLSQTVRPADLGRYAIAVSLTSLPIPLAAAIGNVAFPRLAAQRATGPEPEPGRLERMAVVSAAGIAAALLIPLAAVAYWAVPLVFGPAYSGAVPLLWVLTPGAVFLACGQVAGDLLRGRGQPSLVAWAQGLAAVFTVLLLLALLPVIGIYGAAIASTISYGIALAAMLNRLLRRPPPARLPPSRAADSEHGRPGLGAP
jgi:O-antigen/teichoic acid export membrane protein